MDYNIVIGSPILVTGQEFRTRIRAYPAGSFGSVITFTGNTLTYTGLSSGQYEVEVIFYDGAEECPADYIIFTATEDTACPTFSAVMMNAGTSTSITWVRVSWSGVVGYPACGYRFLWSQGASSGTISFPTALPAAGFTDIIVPSGTTPVNLIVSSDNCYEEKACFDTTVTNSSGCTGLVISDHSISVGQNNYYWVLTLYFTQSTPATISSTITYLQTNGTANGVFTATIAPTATSYSFTVFVPSYTGARPTFKGTLIDKCGNSIPFTI